MYLVFRWGEKILYFVWDHWWQSFNQNIIKDNQIHINRHALKIASNSIGNVVVLVYWPTLFTFWMYNVWWIKGYFQKEHARYIGVINRRDPQLVTSINQWLHRNIYTILMNSCNVLLFPSVKPPLSLVTFLLIMVNLIGHSIVIYQDSMMVIEREKQISSHEEKTFKWKITKDLCTELRNVPVKVGCD